METFPKFLSKMRFNHDTRVVAKFGENRPLRSCRKVISYIADKKTGVGDTFERPISPPRNRSRPKFRERCRPYAISYYLCMCTDFGSDRLRFAGLIPERVQKVNTI